MDLLSKYYGEAMKKNIDTAKKRSSSSTNQEEQRYSKELLVAVQTLMQVEDPVKKTSADYRTSLSEGQFETLGIIRRNAYIALANIESGSEPILEEDKFFLM